MRLAQSQSSLRIPIVLTCQNGNNFWRAVVVSILTEDSDRSNSRQVPEERLLHKWSQSSLRIPIVLTRVVCPKSCASVASQSSLRIPIVLTVKIKTKGEPIWAVVSILTEDSDRSNTITTEEWPLWARLNPH